VGAALIIRPARAEERPLLIGLQRQASLMWEEDRDALLAEPDAIDVPASQIAEGHVHVCERAGLVIGFCVIIMRADGAAELDGLFVEPAAWGEGIGRRLLALAEGQARAAGALSLHVIANRRAVGFYAACGFDTIGETATRFNPALAMGKALAGVGSDQG
jgi:GNAT superfamily N-acetyltransferase